MRNWTIGKRIVLGFAAVLAIMLALGIFVRVYVGVVQNGMTNVATRSLPGLEFLADIKQNANELRILTFKHISSPDAADMAQLEAKMAADSEQVIKDFDNFEKMASPQAKALLDQAKARRETYRAVRAQIIALSRAATNTAASAQVYAKARAELDPVTFTYIDALTQCQKQVSDEANASAETVLSAIHGVNLGLMIGLATALVVGAGLAFFITRGTTRVLARVTGSLNEGSNQVASAANQVSSASQSLAQGSGEQAASLEQTSSSLEEMASMTKRNAENAGKANDIAKQAREAADKGVTDMQTMAAAMDAIKVSSDDIAKIIKTIDEIAFQTNILALNAAVEAARAGEAGMGFAVVADEVRNLAQRCAQAAKETAGKIEGAITKTGQGVDISSKVALALNDIAQKVRQVDELVTEVTSASREQSSGITQINTAVSQMDQVTQSNAASAEESAAAAQELNAQAEVMKRSVGELLQLVGNHGGTAAGKAAAGAPPAAKSVSPVRPAVKRATLTTTNGNGRAPALATSAKRLNAIPLEGDFKNF